MSYRKGVERHGVVADIRADFNRKGTSRMLDWLLRLDERGFVLLNSRLHCGLLDAIMPAITTLSNWILPLGLLLLAAICFGGARGRRAVGLALLAVALSDQLSSSLLKNLVARTRPCHVVDPVRLLVGCSGSFSFPSSHAANIACAATVFAGIFPRLIPVLAVLAFLIGYSRVYVGVHYPFDVLAGWTLGLLVGGAIVRLYHAASEKPSFSFRRNRSRRSTSSEV
jgi:undecaprenyl-diphosphatase